MLSLHKFASIPGNGSGTDDKSGDDNKDTEQSLG